MIANAEERYRLLLRVAEAANAQLELGGVLRSVAEVLVPLVPIDAIGIVTVQGQELRPHSIHIEGVQEARGESWAGRVPLTCARTSTGRAPRRSADD